jgi:hypothetical protein
MQRGKGFGVVQVRQHFVVDQAVVVDLEPAVNNPVPQDVWRRPGCQFGFDRIGIPTISLVARNGHAVIVQNSIKSELQRGRASVDGEHDGHGLFLNCHIIAYSPQTFRRTNFTSRSRRLPVRCV